MRWKWLTKLSKRYRKVAKALVLTGEGFFCALLRYPAGSGKKTLGKKTLGHLEEFTFLETHMIHQQLGKA